MKKVAVVLFLVSVFSGVSSAQEYVLPNAKLFVAGPATVDASHSDDEAEHIDFTAAVIAALKKKKVPVVVVMDPERADYVIQHTSSSQEDGTATQITKAIFGGGSTTRFEGSFLVISKESTAVVFSYNVKKNNFQSAAESFAKHFKNHIKDGIKKNKKSR